MYVKFIVLIQLFLDSQASYFKQVVCSKVPAPNRKMLVQSSFWSLIRSRLVICHIFYPNQLWGIKSLPKKVGKFRQNLRQSSVIDKIQYNFIKIIKIAIKYTKYSHKMPKTHYFLHLQKNLQKKVAKWTGETMSNRIGSGWI